MAIRSCRKKDEKRCGEMPGNKNRATAFYISERMYTVLDIYSLLIFCEPINNETFQRNIHRHEECNKRCLVSDAKSFRARNPQRMSSGSLARWLLDCTEQ